MMMADGCFVQFQTSDWINNVGENTFTIGLESKDLRKIFRVCFAMGRDHMQTFKVKVIFVVWKVSQVLWPSEVKRENTRDYTCCCLRHTKVLYPHPWDFPDREVFVEDLLMPSKHEHQQLLILQIPPKKLNSRSVRLDLLLPMHGDKGHLLDLNVL